MTNGSSYILPHDRLQNLYLVLKKRGYTIIGPKEKDGALSFEPIQSVADLPKGRTDIQEPGRYQLKQDLKNHYFNFTVGPSSLRKFFQPARERLVSVSRESGSSYQIDKPSTNPLKPMAFIGLRSCDLAALAIHDKVLLQKPFINQAYQQKRSGHFYVAVQCAKSSSTCFCVSMKTGPKAESGFDLALTEFEQDGSLNFYVECGSPAGADVLADLQADLKLAPSQTLNAVQKVWSRAASEQSNPMPTEGLPEMLLKNWEHSHWNDVASRCLSCANCTLVCPTCFCTSTEEVTDLTGDHAERWQNWESCFNGNHSYMHGGQQRPTIRSRYRQWLTHKLGTWHQQFGTSGCVGCGRCIAWCPVGIDIRQEIKALNQPSQP